MNVEAFYIQTEDQSTVVAAIKRRLNSETEKAGSQANAPLPSGYDAYLRADPKRKLLVSPPQQGWITVLESKEVVDFHLAERLSAQLKTAVLILQLYETVGGRGMALLRDGAVVLSNYSEDDDDPWQSIRIFLAEHGMHGRLLKFRDAIDLEADGWVALAR